MTEVICDMEKYRAVGQIYNELIDVVKMNCDIDSIENSKRREMAKIMHELALMIQEE